MGASLTPNFFITNSTETRKTKMDKKKTKKLFIVVGIAVIVLTVPALIYYFVNRDKGSDEPKLVWKPLSEVLEEAPDIIGKTYENLILPDSIELGDPEALYVIRDGESMDEDTTIKECLKLLNSFNYDKVTEQDITVDYFTDGGFQAQYISDPEDPSAYSCYMMNDGGILLWQPYVIQKTTGFPDREAIYEVGKDDLSSVVYTVDGEEYSAQQALDFAGSIANGKLKDYISYDNLVPTYVIAAKNTENSDYTYYVGYSYYLDGVEVNNSQVARGLEGISLMSSCMEIMISSPDTLTQVTGGSLFEHSVAEKLDDSYITLGSALDYTEDILAQYFIHEIQQIDIIYAGKTAYGKEDEEFFGEYRPMWRLTVKDVSTAQLMPARYCIYIDMVTGEVILLNDITGEFVSDIDRELETEYLI